jgi:hypothetical protein
MRYPLSDAKRAYYERLGRFGSADKGLFLINKHIMENIMDNETNKKNAEWLNNRLNRMELEILRAVNECELDTGLVVNDWLSMNRANNVYTTLNYDMKRYVKEIPEIQHAETK